MQAALEHLVERAGPGRKVAVLGEMAELGAETGRFHQELGATARRSEFDFVIGVGDLERCHHPHEWAPNAAAAVDISRIVVKPGDTVLVKASRRSGSTSSPSARADGRSVTRVLIAALVALIVSILVGPSSSTSCAGTNSANTSGRRGRGITSGSRERRRWAAG